MTSTLSNGRTDYAHAPIAVTAAVLGEKDGPFQIRELMTEPLRADEALVRIFATGICQTDTHSRALDMPVSLPTVLGHEGAGVVEAVGASIVGVEVGDHVVLSFPACGKCRACLTGAPANCVHGFDLSFACARLDGSNAYGDVHGHFFGQSSFANLARVTQRNLVVVDRDMPLELAGPLGCGVQTGAGAVLNSLRVGAGQSLVVIGTGTVGLSAIMAGKIAGASPLIAVDINPDRLALAVELGATHTINGRGDVLEAVAAIAPNGVDFVLEVTGIPAMLDLGLHALAPMGTVALIGGAASGTTAGIDMNQLLNGGRRLQGVVQGDSVPQLFIPKLIDFYRAGQLPLERLVRFYDFTEINEAFGAAASGTAIKPVLVMPKA